jgi:hypothetical protein
MIGPGWRGSSKEFNAHHSNPDHAWIMGYVQGKADAGLLLYRCTCSGLDVEGIAALEPSDREHLKYPKKQTKYVCAMQCQAVLKPPALIKTAR